MAGTSNKQGGAKLSPADLFARVRQVPDFPKKGVLFYDLSTVLQDGDAFPQLIDQLQALASDATFDKIAAIDARGFLFQAPLGDRLKKGIIILRKPGKLPGKTLKAEYTLEYGSSTLEMTDSAISRPGERVLLIDDVLATGGTAAAATKLITQAGGIVVKAIFVIEIRALGGSRQLNGVPVASLFPL